MASISTKFGVGDTAYLFDYRGVITRVIISGININTSNFNTEVVYTLKQSSIKDNGTGMLSKAQEQAPEQDVYTDVEVKELANTWLLEKSVSIFTNAGL